VAAVWLQLEIACFCGDWTPNLPISYWVEDHYLIQYAIGSHLPNAT